MTSWPRRSLLSHSLGIAAVAGLGLAPRPAAAAGSVLAVPVPQRRRDGDLVGVVLDGSGAPGGTVSVFGQVFVPGALPRGHTVAARGPDDAAIETQLDVIARHPDGSVRFAVVSLAPAVQLRPGARLGVMLSAIRAAPAGEAGLRAALEQRSAVVELSPPGGAPWRVDLIDLLRRTRPAGHAVWQDGPLAWQGRVAVPVPARASGGVTSLRLVADLSLRRDGSLWADAWLRNDIAMQPGGGAARYAQRWLLDGREALRFPLLDQHHYTALGRMAGTRPDGSAAPVPAGIRHDMSYLADTGAVARYNQSIGVNDQILAGYARAMATPDWGAALGTRNLTQYMPMTGARPDIGPTTQAQAAWLLTGDPRAAGYAIGQAEAGGAVPWHHWDPGAGPDGGWLDVRRWPRLWTDGRGGPPPGGLAQPVSNDSGWTPESAHQPDLAFVPALLTGRRALVDELLAQSAWNIVTHWPDPRGQGQANLIRGQQVRAVAWSMRQISEAAWAAPDEDGQKAYFTGCEGSNWAFMRSQIPTWTAAHGETHGRIPSDYEPAAEMRPWQQDYLASTLAAAARRGNEDARALLAWMRNFLVGRFLMAQKGFNPRDGVAYLVAVGDLKTGAPYRSWGEMGQQTQARGWSNGQGWDRSQGNYAQLALMTLACIVDVVPSDDAHRAYAWLSRAGAPFTSAIDYAREPVVNVVPKSAQRPAGSR